MNKLKVCFVGVGSIAKRHIRNLYEICEEKSIAVTIDACRRQKVQEENLNYVSTIYYSYEQLPKDYDVIFITNPTEFHVETLYKLNDNAKNFFIEKPLTSVRRSDDIKKLILNQEKVYYVACPLRYHSVIQYVKENISPDDVIAIRCISSSYLPEWRMGIDYRKTYSADKELGGGVSIDLIHEWDYLKYIFGMPESVKCMIGNVSDLEINSDDYALYIAKYKDKILELHLDYFGRKAVREMMLFTREDTIICDILNGEISYLKNGKKILLKQNRDDFQKAELIYFLKIIEGKVENDNTIWDAYHTLNLTVGVMEE